MIPALRNSAAHVFVASLEVPQPEPDDLNHLFRVLRLRDGDEVTASDGAGSWRVTCVRGGALVPLGDVVRELPQRHLSIAAAIPKGDRVEWMVQKLTELGVAEIVLLHCSRSVVRWDGERAPKQMARLARIAREAAMQSRRVYLPALRGPVAFADAAATPGAVLADPDASEVFGPLMEPEATMVLIGPEGGFHPDELSVPVLRKRLVNTVLRVETAAIAAASVMLTGC